MANSKGIRRQQTKKSVGSTQNAKKKADDLTASTVVKASSLPKQNLSGIVKQAILTEHGRQDQDDNISDLKFLLRNAVCKIRSYNPNKRKAGHREILFLCDKHWEEVVADELDEVFKASLNLLNDTDATNRASGVSLLVQVFGRVAAGDRLPGSTQRDSSLLGMRAILLSNLQKCLSSMSPLTRYTGIVAIHQLINLYPAVLFQILSEDCVQSLITTARQVLNAAFHPAQRRTCFSTMLSLGRQLISLKCSHELRAKSLPECLHSFSSRLPNADQTHIHPSIPLVESALQVLNECQIDGKEAGLAKIVTECYQALMIALALGADQLSPNIVLLRRAVSALDMNSSTESSEGSSISPSTPEGRHEFLRYFINTCLDAEY